VVEHVVGAVKATRGMSHDYLGMRLDFSQKNTVTVDMRAYVVEMIDESKHVESLS
jgi:hypothetical protein